MNKAEQGLSVTRPLTGTEQCCNLRSQYNQSPEDQPIPTDPPRPRETKRFPLFVSPLPIYLPLLSISQSPPSLSLSLSLSYPLPCCPFLPLPLSFSLSISLPLSLPQSSLLFVCFKPLPPLVLSLSECCILCLAPFSPPLIAVPNED